jgi:hypothetical protein
MTNAFVSGDPIFDANPRAVSWLMTNVEERQVALPDFQRDFVWDPADVRDLLVSIISRFPAGTILLLEQGQNRFFKPRAIAGAPSIRKSDRPKFLVLDGQQRLTSLYQAHLGVGDARYLINLSSLVDTKDQLDIDHLDFDDLVVFETVKKKKKPLQSDDPIWQYENWTFPVHKYLTEGFDGWLNEAVDHHGGSPELQRERRLRLAELRQTLLNPLGTYSFPAVELGEETSMYAVCKIFETLNLRGVKLSVFELITARVWAFGQDLRQLWSDAEKNFPILAEFKVDPYNVLQAVTLRSLESAQRSKVLELTADEISRHWSSVIDGYASALELLRDQCWVQTERWLPYTSVVIPMAAAWERLEKLKGIEAGNARERLKQYFWCSVFTTNFDQGGNSQAQADYIKLRNWLDDPSAPTPEAVDGFSFSTSQLTAARRNRRALYRGVMALVMHNGALDFHSKERITASKIAAQEIDAHHLFPRNWLRQNYSENKNEGLSDDLILNFALIDSATNKLISDHAPSAYLGEMLDSEPGPDRDRVLRTHVIDGKARKGMLKDDYEAFIRLRAEDVADEIERVTGRKVLRDFE